MMTRSQAVLGRQAPALGAHLEHADRRRVVDEDLRLAQRADRLRQPAPVALAEKPAAQPVRVDARLGGQHAEEQLLLRHFEAEHADRHVGLGADVLRDVQHEARLPHRRTRRDDDEVRRLKPGRHLVEIGEAGRHAGDQLLARVQLLDRLEARLRQIAQRHEAVADLVVGDREDRVLGLIEDDVGVLLGLVGRRENLVRREDQAAERRLLLDDPRVVLDVGRPRHAVDERRDVGRAADLVELARAAELLLERDEIDRVAALGELDHLVEDAAVRVAEEIAGVDDLGGEVERVVVEQDRAEHGALRLEIVRQRAFGDARRPCGRCSYSEKLVQNVRLAELAVLTARTTCRQSSYACGAPSATTFTLIVAVTSRCSLTGTSTSPIFLIGSASCSLRRSISKPLAASASAMSAVVTEP